MIESNRKKVTASSPISRLFFITGVIVLLVITALCGYKVHSLSDQQQKIKQDYSTVNDITFGLLSISEWRDKIDTLVKQQLETFSMTSAQKQELKAEIEQILNGLIDKAVSLINKPKTTFKGKIEKLAFNAIVNVNELHRQAPVFAEKIIQEINSTSSQRRLSHLAGSKINELEKETYDSAQNIRKTVSDSIFRKYNVSNAAAFDKEITILLARIKKITYGYSFGMLAAVTAILLLWWFLRKKAHLHNTLFIMSVISAFIFLLVGVTTTMLEVDARISSLNFRLIGESITFNNQVLFFQSKSILSVVHILMRTGKIDSMLVGFLILCFSVLFPLCKLLSTGIYLLGKNKWTKSKIVHYFAFKSGKWSMADVMVVAILMTYIAFNSILQSQLSNLNMQSESLTSITTNNTALQPGYLIFTAFVIYGLVLSQILKNITGHKPE